MSAYLQLTSLPIARTRPVLCHNVDDKICGISIREARIYVSTSTTYSLHFLVDNRGDFLQHPQTYRQVRKRAGGRLTNVSPTEEPLKALQRVLYTSSIGRIRWEEKSRKARWPWSACVVRVGA